MSASRGESRGETETQGSSHAHRFPVALLALALAGCPRGGRPLEATFGPTVAWEVAVLAARGDGEIEAHYELLTEKVSATVWRISTLRTHARWNQAGDSATFDSDAPSPADPWPLTLQHLVASVPADVRLEDGRPVEILHEAQWREAARRAVYASALPTEALAAGEALVDPAGLLQDLARTFPGSPEPGTWERTEKVAGVQAKLQETCAWEPDASQWSCAGTAEAQPSENAELYQVATSTQIGVDRQGLLFVETSYSGTLVTLAPGGAGALDQPITGFRRVVRRSDRP